MAPNAALPELRRRGELKIIAAILERPVIEKILTHLDVHWASVAQDSGYADQAHFCRTTRRVTGFSPQVLARRIAQEASFWPYRVWQ